VRRERIFKTFVGLTNRVVQVQLTTLDLYRCHQRLLPPPYSLLARVLGRSFLCRLGRFPRRHFLCDRFLWRCRLDGHALDGDSVEVRKQLSDRARYWLEVGKSEIGAKDRLPLAHAAAYS